MAGTWTLATWFFMDTIFIIQRADKLGYEVTNLAVYNDHYS